MKITHMLSRPKFLGIFSVLAIVFTIIYFVITGLYVVSLGNFLENAEPIRIVLVTLVSLLTALAITLMIYKQEQPLVCGQNAPAFFGSVAALFTTGCPVCFPLLLSTAGIGGAAALTISQNAVPIQLASVVLLTASIWLTTRS